MNNLLQLKGHAALLIRKRKALLNPLLRLVLCVWPFWRSVAATYRVAQRAVQQGTRQGFVPLGTRRVPRNGQVWLVWYLSCRSRGVA